MRNQARPCFALFFGNRGFFPGKLIAGAREALLAAVRRNGFEAICMDESETRYCAVETPEEGRRFAGFLRAHEGEYQGVILSLPNFGDENGALEALRDVRTPILVQAFPDEAGKMDFENRRDSVCGKLPCAARCGRRASAFSRRNPSPCRPTPPTLTATSSASPRSA